MPVSFNHRDLDNGVIDNKERIMHGHLRRILAAASAIAAIAVAAPAATAAQTATAPGGRPIFKMPFHCGQVWAGHAYASHSPAHAIDWNHYTNGVPDDKGRDVVASAPGKVIVSHYSTSNGYGRTIVIAHGDGWQTRYAHLNRKLHAVQRGAHVARGQVIGHVGESSAIYSITPHLHYEQIHNGSVVLAHVQGKTWFDTANPQNQKSTNTCK